jgi:hypothetical protein
MRALEMAQILGQPCEFQVWARPHVVQRLRSYGEGKEITKAIVTTVIRR